jgi:hypothetical protein
MRLTEACLRQIVRQALHESFEDIRDLGVRLRVKVAKPTDPTVPDILTDVRGVSKVITVSQEGPMTPAEDGKSWLNLVVGFVDDKEYDVPDLLRDLRSIDGVDMVRIWEMDPEGDGVSR